MYDVTVIGPAIIDVLAQPVDSRVFETGSQPADAIRMSFGGNALNEAVVLSRLGERVQLLSNLGTDEAGDRVRAFLEKNGIDGAGLILQEGIPTAVNLVLVDRQGERHFITDPGSTLRRLDLPDLMPRLDALAHIVSFSSLFVSPLLTIDKTRDLFRRIKEGGRLLLVDMTKAKHGETLDDLEPLLPCIDVLVPNQEEARLLTGESDPLRSLYRLAKAGVGIAVVKCGADGCLVAAGGRTWQIPAVPGTICVDTTGAGDAFAAGFLAGLRRGFAPDDCARLGCAAASCAVEALGATDGVTGPDRVMERFARLQTI